MKRVKAKKDGTVEKPASKPSQAADPHLTDEERALWRHVASGIKRLRAKSRITDGGVSGDGDAALPSMTTSSSADRVEPRRAGNAASLPAASARRSVPTAAPTMSPSLAEFDPRKAKKLAKGRTGIEARLDLHGLRQDEAHTRLVHFLRDCHQRGLKHVLIITGKGRDNDDPQTPFVDTLDRPARGVIRRNLPRWLDEPELRTFVVGYTSASQRHGGDGAFYVELRRLR